jgi:amino acid adenylation domain-containing protein
MSLQPATVNDLLSSLAEKGVQLWADGDQLRVRAGSGILNGELRDLLKLHKPELLLKLRERATHVVDASLPRITPNLADRHEPFPLNDIQQAYWVGRTGGVELGNVTTHAYIELDGTAVDVGRLSQSLQQVIARQDMLRVMILPTGEQRILAEVPPYEIAVRDLSDRSEAEAEAVLEEVRAEMSHQVLPLDRWPLFDIRVTKLPGGRMRTHFSIDLIITDFGSLHVLLKEWVHYYDRPDEPLPPLELSFRDFILAEQDIQRTELFKRSEKYWLDRLDTLPPRPQLPLATNPGAIEKPRFTRRQFLLEEPQWKRLKERARQSDLTPSGLLLAAFAEVLELWSQSPRFTINLTQYNRLPLHPQVNDIIGNSISVILLAVDNSSKDTFAERAARVQRQLWQDLDHTHMSGVRVIRELARKQGHTASALMPVVFTSILGLETLGRGYRSSGFGSIVYTISQTPQVWLDHQVMEMNGALMTSWDAVEDLFPAGLLDDMFDAYRSLLERLAAGDDVWCAEQTVEVPARQIEIREAVNDTDAPAAEGLLHSALARHAQTAGDAPAVLTSTGALGYRELYERSNRLAHRLRQAGALPNRAVAIVMEKGCEQIVAVMGVLASGATYMPIDPAVPGRRLRSLLERGEVRIVLTQSHLDGALEWPEGVERLTVDTCDLSALDAGPLETVQSPDDLAYVLFTSGSTGEPRGVMVEHRGPLNTARFFNERFGVGPEDRAMALSALNFDLSVYDVFGMCAAGGAMVMPDPARVKDPAHWAELMAAHRVTVWNSVPTLMRMMVEYLSTAPEKVPPGLRLVILSGDWIPVSLPDRIRGLWPGVEVIGAGGPTETSVWNIYNPLGEIDPAWTSIPYGRPIANNRYHVMDERLRHRPDWVAGELMSEGAGLARGYWGDAATTSAKFVADPATGRRLYKTGDLGRYLPDGTLEILGRVDFQVKIDGHRIELGEIEAVLRESPLVRDAVVSAVGEDRGRRRLVAYVVPARHAAEESSEKAQFKLDQHGLRPVAPYEPGIDLPRREFDEARAAAMQARVSTRTFASAPAPLGRVSRLLDCLEQMQRDDWPLPKRLYPSAGSLYPVQTYLHVKKDRVEGVGEGTYYYDPSAHRLVPLTAGARIEAAVHVEHNRAMYEQAAFSVFLIAQMGAIVPIYGQELAQQFCVLEAGYMGQALLLNAHDAELGLCPVGALDYDAVRAPFRLDDGHVFVHSFVGGLKGEAARGEGGGSPEHELRSLVRDRLPEYMAPSVYVFLDALPLNANNKVDRGALPDPSMASSAVQEAVAPRTDIEHALADIVREILGVESVGIHHTFFDLGGTSVDLVKIHNRIKERLARDVRITDLFRRPTVSLLAEYLAEGDNAQALERIDEEAAKRRQARLRRRQSRVTDDAEG